MCGIAGAVWTDPSKGVSEATLRAMVDRLSHRGPDEEGLRFLPYNAVSQHKPASVECLSAGDHGLQPSLLRPQTAESRNQPADGGPYISDAGVALGFRRLSIIDLAGGQQPMCNEDGTIWIVFNGEAYNYAELRRRLEGSGHTFRTRSDTETLVHLYEEEGRDFLQHVVGMFALAIWDGRKRQLLLARDRLGQKPLVYYCEPGRFLFASELKSILAVPGVPREIDANAIDAFLTYQYVPYPMSIFHGIRKLPPAHWGIYADGEFRMERYWSPVLDQVDRSEDEYIALLRQKLSESVRLRLQSDVPLGAFLSGGVDSSLIVGLAQQESAAQIRTFSIGFEQKEYDESAAARHSARRLGTDHQEFRIKPDAVEILPKLVWHYDEPFGDSSSIPTWYVAELARAEVTVVLSGDGGDELFLGYPRYRAALLASYFDRCPRWLRRSMAKAMRAFPYEGRSQKNRLRQLKRLAEVLDLTAERRYLEWMCIFNEERRASLYSEDFVQSLRQEDPGEFVLGALRSLHPRDVMSRVSLADLVTYLPCDLMTKVDIATMAHGLECRQPFLDHRVVELAVQMPTNRKFHRMRGKRILARAFPEFLPRQVMRRPKMGFGVPLEHWFRHDLKGFAREILLDKRAVERGFFRESSVRRMLEEHISGRFNHGYRLWSLLFLELWCQTWADSYGRTR